MHKSRHIGKEARRLLGRQIVTGQAMYTADYQLKHMQYGKILRSPHPYAKITRIDSKRALSLKGVTAVVTYKDVSPDIYITNGFTPPRHHHIMDDYVRYIGDAVALIVAETEDIAVEAMDLIKVEYKILTPVFHIQDAIRQGAPQLYKEFPGNIAPHKTNLNFETGDITKGFSEAEYVAEADVSMENGQNPLPLEAPVIIAYWEEDMLHFIASAAAPSYCQQNVGAAMNIPYENIHITAPAVGGSFGSKLYSGNVHCLVFAALMSKAAHCPVLFKYTKEEHFAVHQTRMSTTAQIKLGMKKGGIITAVSMRQYADAGNCASTQEFMLGVGTSSLGIICKTENKRYDGDVVVTNHVPSGSFRGYGYLESAFMLSVPIFDACEQLGVDPVDYLKRNVLAHGEKYYNATAPEKIQCNRASDFREVIGVTADKFRWKERFKGYGVPTYRSEDGNKVRGVGVFAAGHSDGGAKPSNANVTITGSGAVYVSTCMSEFGSGIRDIIQKIAAETLDVPLNSVKLSPSDTGVTPPEFGSTASRSTFCGGTAVKLACEDAKKKLFELAYEKLGIPTEDCGFRDGYIYRLSEPDIPVPLCPNLLGRVDGITGCGHFEGVENSIIFNVQFVEVEVDLKMGTFEIVDHLEGCDAGTIINPLPLKNQVQSFFAGVDIACMEETVWDPHDYRVLNPNMIDYHTRTFNDVIPHDHIILESNKGRESQFPFGAFGVGEAVLSPGGPAIRLAIYNACKIKLNSYPFSPDKILKALREKESR